MDFTGCGNGFNMRSPRVLQLIMDSLRYWVTEMHVDGFRFDLASALARELYEVDKLGAFFDIMHQDPVLSQVKLIAEPWDLGSGGYQVGNFPSQWSEWNGRYRDNVRRFWKGDGGTLVGIRHAALRLGRLVRMEQPTALLEHQFHHLPRRLQPARPGELQLQTQRGQRRRQSRRRERQPELELRRRRARRDDAAIKALRERQKRNMLATLFLSQGVPMLLAGDELGKTQQGNNNCYCQDNEISWLQWDLNHEQQQMLEFVRGIVAMRKTEPVFRRQKFFQGRSIRGGEDVAHDVGWIGTDGKEVSDEVWNAGFIKCLGLRLGWQADRRSQRARRADRRRYRALALKCPL